MSHTAEGVILIFAAVLSAGATTFLDQMVEHQRIRGLWKVMALAVPVLALISASALVVGLGLMALGMVRP